MRSNFSSSTLVRQLGEWTPLEADASGMDFAERLSLWLDAFDAIGLQAAHQAIQAAQEGPSSPASRPPRGGVRAPALHEDVERVRGALAQAIAQDPRQLARDADAETEGYAPFMQRHQALQRQMEQMIAPLRDHVRQAVGRACPRLQPLVALDAALEQALGEREQALMPTVARLLARRYEQLRPVPAGEPDAPAPLEGEAGAPPAHDDEWQHAFASEWRQALLAELDLRLQPVMGLVEALGNESKQQA